MTVDRSDVCEKLESISEIHVAWVSDSKQEGKLKVAVKLLAMEVGQREVDPTVLAALDNFADKLGDYLKDIDRRADNLHEEMMDAIPEGDD